MGEGEGVHNLQSKADFEAAKEKPGVMIIDCFAVWCGPCKVIAPILVNFAKKYENARFYKIDVDEVPDVSQELGITAMPTILVFKDGEKVDTVIGANPPAIEAAIRKVAVA